jgi:hypothetical protein
MHHLQVPQLETLVILNGTLSDPVRNVAIHGLTFRDTKPTFMQRYTGAGPGDWSIYTSGTVLLQGTEGCTIERW